MSGLSGGAASFPYEFSPLVRSRAREYESGALRLSLLGGTLLPLALALGLLASGGSRALAEAAAAAAPHWPSAAVALFVLGLSLLASAVTFPLAFYGRHVREARYAMTRRSSRAFAVEAGKAAALATLAALALLVPLYWLMRNVDMWWAAAAALYAIVVALSSFVLPNLVLPLFYKVEPLADGELRASVVGAAAAVGAPPITRIAVLRESAKSPRANAFIHGLGPSRRVVLLDTLLANFHPREVRFTVAHEAAHLAHRDVARFLALDLALVPLNLYLLSLLMPALAPSFGLSGVSDPAGIPLLLVTVGLIELAERALRAPLSRRAEARADASALAATQDGEAAESMLKRLCDLNLLDESPNRLLHAVLASHPTPFARIQAARAFAAARALGATPQAPASFTSPGTIRASSENP